MDSENTAFGMTYEEFCEQYDKMDSYGESIYKNHPVGENFYKELVEGSELLNQHPDMVKRMV